MAHHTCRRCEQELAAEATRCSCGTLTALATFKDRNESEVAQWRSYQRSSDQTGG